MLDYHVHLFSHDDIAYDEQVTLSAIAQLCSVAKKRNLTEIAITEHLFRFKEAKHFFTKMTEEVSDTQAADFMRDYYDFHATLSLEHYIHILTEAKRRGFPVAIGIEMDFIPGQMDEVNSFLSLFPFDVVLGSVHFIKGHMFDVLDSDLQVSKWNTEGAEKVFRDYLVLLEELMLSGTANVLAHVDLVKVMGRRPSEAALHDFENELVDLVTRKLVTVGEENRENVPPVIGRTVVELSSAGWRKPIGAQYPSSFILKKLFDSGLGITLASDAHEPMSIGYRFNDLWRLAEEIGYKSLARFSDRSGYPYSINKGKI